MTQVYAASSGAAPTTGRRPRRAKTVWLLAVIALMIIVAAISVAIGSRVVSLSEIVSGLQGHTDTLGEASVVKRIPRTVLAILVGAALGMSGGAMQGVTRNPLADPGILGVNMGASLAVICGMAWFGLWTATATIWTAIAGAAIAAVLVYTIGSLGRGGATPLKLTLAGAATSVAFASFISAVALPRTDIAESVRSWQIGGVGGASFDTIRLVAPFLLAGAVICLLTARGLNSLALGDDLAAGLGEHVAFIRCLAAFGAVLLCGSATAIAGPIGFVGLVVPHLCRLLVGVDYRWLLPFSAFVGACLLMASDVVGRVVARPTEIDVGIITALVGAPFFIAIVRRQKVREL